MKFSSWLNALKGSPSRRPIRRAEPRRKSAIGKLAVEHLEARTVPAFLTPADYALGSSPQAVISGDFNGDTIQDLAVANSFGTNSVSVLLGNANGTFQSAVNSNTGYYPYSLAAGDFNGDGKLDLVTVNPSFPVSVLLGNGNGTFQPASSIDPGSPPVSVAVGDFDGDGKLDLGVTTNRFVVDYYGYYGPYGHHEGEAKVLLGNGDGSFDAALTTALGYGNPRGVAVADFNGDGKDDFATTDGVATVSVLLADGSGNLLAPSGLSTGSGVYPQSVAVGDFNADGIADLVTRNSNSVSVFLGNGTAGVGDGTFRAAQTTALNFSPVSVAVGDFNADGKLDLAASSNRFVVDYYGYYGFPYGHYERQVDVLLGQGNSFFAAPLTTALGVGTFGVIASGDFDEDGYTDLAVAKSDTSKVSVLINDQSWPPLPPPSVSIGDATVTEGNTGSTTATFTLTLQFAHDEDLTVHYSTANGSATAGNDFTGISGDVTFAAGETSKTITVSVLGDRLAEPSESFFVNLTSTDAPIGDGSGFGIITDNEPTISISGPVTVTEGNTGTRNATFTVTLSEASDAPVSVDYATADLPYDEQYWYLLGATGGVDYTAATGTLTFAAGETSKTITVRVLGDRVAEEDEWFLVTLGNSSGAHLAPGQALGQIVDDEPRVSIEGGGSVLEGNTGTKALTFTITLSSASDAPVSVTYATANGSATSTRDYQAAAGTVTFAPGQTSKTVTVLVKGDRVAEYDEDFYLAITGTTGALVSNGWGYGTILDNEPRISINSAFVTEGNSGTKLMTFTVTLSAAYDQTVTVRYATQNGSARTGNNDYKAASGTLRFLPGETSKTFTVTIKGDTKKEYDEDFYVLLTRPSSNAVLWESTGWGIILNDD